jgi:hypothetical protein
MDTTTGTVTTARGQVRSARQLDNGSVWVGQPGNAANNWQGGWVLAADAMAATYRPYSDGPRLTQEA